MGVNVNDATVDGVGTLRAVDVAATGGRGRWATTASIAALLALTAFSGSNQHLALRDACEARYGVGNCVLRHSTWVPLASATTTSSTAPSTTSTTSAPLSTTSVAPPLDVGIGLQDLGLVGQWVHHGFFVTINRDGSGVADWRIYTFCSQDPTPPCDQMNGNVILDGGHATFRIRARPQSSVAVATMTSSSDPKTLGSSGTVQVSPILGRPGPGKEIVFPIRSDPSFVLCDAAASVTGDCGA